MEMLAPEELHGLHMEYEANLERALRGIVTVERGCGITRLRHRPPDDEEPFIYYKRGHANITHARMRMAEIVDVMLTWEPGQPAEATVADPHGAPEARLTAGASRRRRTRRSRARASA